MGYLTMFQANMTAGRGFLALAAVYQGVRSVFGTAAAAAFFGLTSVFAAQLGLLGVPTSVDYSVAPLVTIAALLAFSGQERRRRRATIRRTLADLQQTQKEPQDGR